MYDDRSIAWMLSGGNRADTDHQHRDQLHRIALRESQGVSPARGLAIRPLLSRAMASVGLGAVAGASVDSRLDCCAA